MRLETSFEKFDQFIDVPHAIAKMRELILRLAVQGKPVTQDANDEPAENALRKGGVDMQRWAVAEDERRQEVPSSSTVSCRQWSTR
jgi:type I restriction enzyme S subunit